MIAPLLAAASLAWGQSSFHQALQQAQKAKAPDQRAAWYSQAISEFSHDVDAPQDMAIAYVGRAYAYGDLGEYDKALADAAKARKIDPRDWTAHKVGGYLLADLKKCEPAEAAYRQTIALAPAKEQAQLYRELGLILRDCSKALIPARDALGKAVELATVNQDFEELHSSLRALGTLICRMKKHREALAVFDQSLQLGEDARTLYDKGRCLQDAGRPGDAKAVYTQLIERMDSEGQATAQYAEAQRQQDDRTLTVTAVDNTVLPDCYYRRAMILRERGDEANAAPDLARACELGLEKACPKRKRRNRR
jgi:tetratricopeptide (TPR) repeat protein